ncbi:MAG: IS66 family transposase [Nitrospinae bacterium]|nr:IS66 family transposase [Nitrospinota bacterium]
MIEEVPEPQPIEVTEYKINHYHCEGCGIEVVAKATIPDKSRFGVNILAHTTLLKFEDRLPLRKVCSALKRQFNLNVSSATVLDITKRVSDKLDKEYSRIKDSLRKSKSINIDETGIRVDGLNFHLWAFTTKEDTLYLIRKSRGRGVIEDVLGKKYEDVVGSDGWTSYSSYTNNLQRCWAHLLRESKYLADEFQSAKSIHVELKKLYEKAKCKKPPTKDELILEMSQWTDYADCFTELRKFSVKMKHGLVHWFTFVGNKDVEPTNNSAEWALRVLIVQRKIMGTLRNEKGTTIMEWINSCIMTWKLKGLNPFTVLKAQLR